MQDIARAYDVVEDPVGTVELEWLQGVSGYERPAAAGTGHYSFVVPSV
jgi:hypothetical protein